MTISFPLLLNRRINLRKEQERKSPFRNYNIPRPSNIGFFFLELVEKSHIEEKGKKKKREGNKSTHIEFLFWISIKEKAWS